MDVLVSQLLKMPIDLGDQHRVFTAFSYFFMFLNKEIFIQVKLTPASNLYMKMMFLFFQVLTSQYYMDYVVMVMLQDMS